MPLKAEQKPRIPTAAIVLLTAVPARQALTPAPVGRGTAANRTDRNPTGHNSRQGVAVAQADLKLLLNRIDLSHAGTELGSMHLFAPLDPVHPGVDHFVAKSAEGGYRRQRRQDRTRQHDFANPWTTPVEAGRAGHAAVTPTQFQRWPCQLTKAAKKVLPVEPVEQRW